MPKLKVDASNLVPVTSILEYFGYSQKEYRTFPLSYIYWLIRRFYLITGRAVVA